MAEPINSSNEATIVGANATPQAQNEALATASRAAPRPTKERKPPFHQIHKQPAPIRVFPFPTFAVGNPVSLLHLAAAWLNQIFSPPPAEPSVIHTAHWHDGTRSIFVTDEKSIADLWQQGFYGKGSLSRSEPNWLKREKIRRGALEGVVSEANTDKRREERMRTKWERARAEQEALEQKRFEEQKALAEAQAEAEPTTKRTLEATIQASSTAPATLPALPPVGPLELLALPNSCADLAQIVPSHSLTPATSMDSTQVSVGDSASSGNDEVDSNTTVSDTNEVKHRKSVRFSPDVQSTVFQRTDPPTPIRSLSSSSVKDETNSEPKAAVQSAEAPPPTAVEVPLLAAAAEAVAQAAVVVNKEHLQLVPEEAFFLAFAFGALKVVDDATQNVLSTRDLFTLLRQNSYFPPRSSEQLEPDDPFLIHYAVYHHFRSLGWVPRPGIKFGVDCE